MHRFVCCVLCVVSGASCVVNLFSMFGLLDVLFECVLRRTHSATAPDVKFSEWCTHLFGMIRTNSGWTAPTLRVRRTLRGHSGVFGRGGWGGVMPVLSAVKSVVKIMMKISSFRLRAQQPPLIHPTQHHARTPPPLVEQPHIHHGKRGLFGTQAGRH
jgi:hypothetical protein